MAVAAHANAFDEVASVLNLGSVGGRSVGVGGGDGEVSQQENKDEWFHGSEMGLNLQFIPANLRHRKHLHDR